MILKLIFQLDFRVSVDCEKVFATKVNFIFFWNSFVSCEYLS